MTHRRGAGDAEGGSAAAAEGHDHVHILAHADSANTAMGLDANAPPLTESKHSMPHWPCMSARRTWQSKLIFG